MHGYVSAKVLLNLDCGLGAVRQRGTVAVLVKGE